MAFASRRPAAAAAERLFKPQPARVKTAVVGPHVPKGSLTYSVVPAGELVVTGTGKPERGSIPPATTARVVAGSKTVPVGKERFKASVWVPPGPAVMRSVRSV